MPLNKSVYTITFPIFDSVSNEEEQEIVQIFLQRFRDVRFLCNTERVFSAITKTANLTGNSIEFISKTLVSNGLKASKDSFSEEFLSHVNESVSRIYVDLKKFWIENAHDHHGDFRIYNQIPSFVTV